MKGRIVTAEIGLVSAVTLLAGCGQDQRLQETQRQLTTATNELAAVRFEVAEVKTQMQVNVNELQQKISKLTPEKTDVEKKMDELKADLEQKLDAERTKIHSLESDNSNLTAKTKSLNDQLADTNQRLTDLQNTHAQTI